jgi:hypothetical protein
MIRRCDWPIEWFGVKARGLGESIGKNIGLFDSRRIGRQTEIGIEN